MKKWLFRLIFGIDALGDSMFHMLTIRKQVVEKHTANKEAAMRLAKAQGEVIDLKLAYDIHRDALEQAYKLNLD